MHATDHFLCVWQFVMFVAEIYASDIAIVYPEQVQKRVLSRVKDLLRLSCLWICDFQFRFTVQNLGLRLSLCNWLVLWFRKTRSCGGMQDTPPGVLRKTSWRGTKFLIEILKTLSLALRLEILKKSLWSSWFAKLHIQGYVTERFQVRYARHLAVHRVQVSTNCLQEN